MTITKTKTRRKAKPQTKAAKTVLVLRTCATDMSSSHGFKWPESGPVSCSDWKPTNACGNGLHGWLWGAGDWSLKTEGENIKWLVVDVVESDCIDLGGKVKFPRGNVVACYGHWREAMSFIRQRLDASVRPQAVATGEREYASATGNSGHASATGNYGHASATGDSGHASATGDSGHASATGDSGHASATGNYGHASATGNYGHASATGDSGWSVAGFGGKAKANQNGAITILWWDGSRPRVVTGYVGENGVEADKWYRVEDGKLVEAK